MSVVSKEELPSKELRDLAEKMKRGYTLERTSGNHFRVRNPQGELVQFKDKNLRVTSSVRNMNSVEADFKSAGVLKAPPKPKRMTQARREASQRGIEAMQASQRSRVRERRAQSVELRSRMQPWMKAIGADTPGVLWDLARYLHKTSNGAYASVESAVSALKNVREGQGIKDETRAPIDELSRRFETEAEPLMLYVEVAREARGIEPVPASGKEWPFTMKLVDVAACFVDKYQRPVRERIVRDRVLHFDERKVAAILVSARADETFAILDGQTRWRVCEIIGKKRIWAAVFEGMTVADEARFFYEVNHDRLAVHPYYGFLARVLGGDKKAVEINQIVERTGFRIAPNTDWARGGIAAVSALERAYDQPSDVREDPLTPALERMSRWKGMKNSTGAELIRGFGRFYAAFSDEEIDETHLGELLDSFGPAPVLARSRDMAERAGRLKHVGSASSGVHLAKALVEIHNTGKPRGERLDVNRIPYA